MTDQANPVRWGILGAARIADGAILPGIGKSAWARAHAIAARDLTRAQAMAEKHAIARAYGSGPASPHLARIVSDRHAARLTELLADARAKGAQVTLDQGAKGRTFGPALIEAITPEMRLDQEEIFGPLLPILPYSDLGQVIDGLEVIAQRR